MRYKAYDIHGTARDFLYDIDSESLSDAFDIDGNSLKSYGDIKLKVCNYNVGGWYIGSGSNVPASEDVKYYALQNGMISAINADILCIEEYWTNFSPSRTAESLLSQYYPYIRSNGGGSAYFGRAICSKYPIVSYTSNNFSVDSGRYFDVAKIDVDGLAVYVFVTHLSVSNQSYKIQQATQIFNYIKNRSLDPFIVCGDFNSNLEYPMTEINAGIYKQFVDDGCALANDGAFGILNTACNSSDWSEAFAIDNIIVSDAFKIKSVSTDLTKTTDSIVDKIDHIPLIAELETY